MTNYWNGQVSVHSSTQRNIQNTSREYYCINQKCAKPTVTSSPAQDQYLYKVNLDTPVHSVRNLGATVILTTENQTVQ